MEDMRRIGRPNQPEKGCCERAFTTLGIGVLTASTAIGGCKSIPLLVVGIGICVVWLLCISSFKTLNDAKFAVIDSMESQMQSRPFADEWKRLTGSKKYNKQTTIEKALPVLFCFVFCSMIVLVLF